MRGEYCIAKTVSPMHSPEGDSELKQFSEGRRNTN